LNAHGRKGNFFTLREMLISGLPIAKAAAGA
jgi:hypothetical protein